MCSVKKFCFFVRLDIGCLLIGCYTFVESLFTVMYCLGLLILELRCPTQAAQHLLKVMQVDLVDSPLKTILSLIIMVHVLWMFFSVLLIVGIKKNRSNFLLCYFSFGTVMTILMMLSGLLFLLTNHHKYMSLVEFIGAIMYVHCLIVVHSTYELMQRGIEFGPNKHRLLTEDYQGEPTPV